VPLFVWSLGLALPFLTAVAHNAVGFPATVFDSELEAMILAQEADIELLPRFQVAPGSISLVANINPNGGQFSYSTLRFTTYAGLFYSLTASGTYDPTAHTGSWTSAAALSSEVVTESWTGTGTLAPGTDPSSSDVAFLADSCTGKGCDWSRIRKPPIIILTSTASMGTSMRRSATMFLRSLSYLRARGCGLWT
jgi:hypothetical protein